MIIGITFLSFLLSYLSPGDPAQILLNNQGVKASEEALQSTRHELGLDRPMIVQYGDWLMDLCKGDMGSSYTEFFNDTATTEIYTLSLHDALPI